MSVIRRPASETVDKFFIELQRRREFFTHMTEYQVTEYHLNEAVQAWRKWFANANQWVLRHKRDAFDSWFDANYPDYEGHANEVWRRIQKQ